MAAKVEIYCETGNGSDPMEVNHLILDICDYDALPSTTTRPEDMIWTLSSGHQLEIDIGKASAVSRQLYDDTWTILI